MTRFNSVIMGDIGFQGLDDKRTVVMRYDLCAGFES